MSDNIINASNYSSYSYIVPYIRYCAKDYYTGPWKLYDRKIDDYEFIFITDGQGIFNIEGREYKVVKNDLILIKPGLIHSGFSSVYPFGFLCIHFDIFLSKEITVLTYKNNFLYESIPIKPIKYYKALLDFPEFTSNYDNVSLYNLFYKIMEENEKKNLGYIIVLKSLFLELLYKMFRLITHTQIDDKPEQVKLMIEYIKENYMNKINLKQISDHVHLQTSYVSSLFKKHMGITITEFINRYRIAVAKEFLLNSNQKISDIAINTGFYDIHHFTKVFVKYEGMTPGEFRKIKV